MQTTTPQWLINARFLWERRRMLARVTIYSMLAGVVLVFLLPNKYESTARIMPPDSPGGGTAVLAALMRSSGSSLSGVASSLLGVRSSGALFMDMLQSRTIHERIIDRFGLQKIYREHYRFATEKKLAKRTSISSDAKSGVITITVTDTDRHRACEMTQAYLDELNALMARTNTSSAHLERVFIEQRLATVQNDLEQAQIELSRFSQAHTAIDIKEQTRAMVDAGARLQGELIMAQTELESTSQIYGNDNVRVRAARARVGTLQSELGRMSGTGTAQDVTNADHPYPALRQLPELGVQWADRYRKVRIQETVFDLLSAQHESARIEEAKTTPVVSVIDPPSWPEKKSSPHRLLLLLGITFSVFTCASLYLLAQKSWRQAEDTSPAKALALEIQQSLRALLPWHKHVSDGGAA